MDADAAIDDLLAQLDALEAACTDEQWEQAAERMSALDAAIRVVDWSRHGADSLRRVLDRQQALAVRFIALREEAATVLAQLNLNQKARASYARSPK